MRHFRPALATALVATVAVAGVAGAATKPKPKPVCNLVTDPAGDASLQSPLPSDDAMDVISADVASNAKSFTAVIRMKNVSASGVSQLGRVAHVYFNLPGADAQIFMSYTNSPYGGDAYEYGLVGKGTGGSTSPTGDAQGIVDTAKNEIRITVPVADLSALGKAKPGAKVTGLTVSVDQVVGVAPNASGVYGYEPVTSDEATGTKSYIAGSLSCVTPGK